MAQYPEGRDLGVAAAVELCFLTATRYSLLNRWYYCVDKVLFYMHHIHQQISKDSVTLFKL